MNNIEKLRSAVTKSDLSDLLGISHMRLTYVIYVLSKRKSLYTTFQIPKKSGGQRTINAPIEELREIQKKLSKLLMDCISEIRVENGVGNIVSHGFERQKSIVTNANTHKNKKFVLNLDIEDFFDSINFGRVRGFFQKNKNFMLSDDIATLIAQIACSNNKLPQGSPCSPVISNLISGSMDMRILSLCTKNRCHYSRYADDITISTNIKKLGSDILDKQSNKNTIEIGSKLKKEIERSGFSINKKKNRLQYSHSRQEVTGIVVNRKVSIKEEYHKKARSLCNHLFTKGSFYIIDKKTGMPREGTLNYLEGVLSFINIIDVENRKQNNEIDLLDKNKRERLYSDFLYFKNFHCNSNPIIVTEGHTDVVHLKCAIKSLQPPELLSGKKIKASFYKNSKRNKFFFELPDGSGGIKKIISNYKENFKKYKGVAPKKPVILLLDNDSGSEGSNGIFSYIRKNIIKGKSVEDIRKMPYIHLFHNLYIVFTPLIGGAKESCIEDFYEQSVLDTVLSGKVFNKTNKKLAPNEYGKDYFSKYVVYDNRDKINFSKFNILLERIISIINLYP